MLIFPLLYFTIVVLVVKALWRIMKAQEATAQALQQIAEVLARRSDPLT